MSATEALQTDPCAPTGSHAPAIFYHCYAAGRWQEPTRDFLDALEEGEFSARVFVGLVGTREQRQDAIAKIRERRPQAAVAAEAETGWEQVTLHALHAFCHATNRVDSVGYFHSKGSANHGPDSPAHAQRQLVFRRMVAGWREAVTVLEDEPYVRGNLNLWWARTDHIRRLARCCDCDRGEAEAWLGGYTLHTPQEERMDSWLNTLGLEPEDLDAALDLVYDVLMALVDIQRGFDRPLSIHDLPRAPGSLWARQARLLIASGKIEEHEWSLVQPIPRQLADRVIGQKAPGLATT